MSSRGFGAALDRGASRAEPGADAIAERVVGTVRAAWPGLGVDPVAFLEHLGSLLAPSEPLAFAAEGLAAEDVYLAFACSRADKNALVAFERLVTEEIRAATAKLRLAPDKGDDLRQLLWQKLLVPSEGRPKILEFSGRGRLRHWVRVAAVRLALDDLRSQRSAREMLSQDELLGVASTDNDPEMQVLKQLYGREFRQAFEQAIGKLSPEDRNTLRSYYSAGLTIDEMAAGFGIHRATAARRVAKARMTLLAATRRELGERLRLSTAELKSVMRLIQSQLHVSVQRLLG